MEYPLLLLQIKALGLPTPTKEYVFSQHGRDWAFDICWPDCKVAMEIEGVHYGKDGMMKGRHVSISGYPEDMQKYNTAAALGWRLFRATPAHVDNGTAAAWLRCAMQDGPIPYAAQKAPKRKAKSTAMDTATPSFTTSKKSAKMSMADVKKLQDNVTRTSKTTQPKA